MKSAKSENYLDKCPVRCEDLKWSSDENGIVTLDMENKGLVNKLAQKLLKKPPVSHIHLDELGSFVWLETDGKNSIYDIGESVKSRFGQKAEPLYERLAGYFRSLEVNGFIYWDSIDENK